MADLIIKPSSSNDSLKFQRSDGTTAIDITGTTATLDSGLSLSPFQSGFALVKKFNNITVSNSAVSFNDIFNTTYKDYLMYLTGTTNNGGTQSYINMRFRNNSSGQDSSSNYRFALRGYDNSGNSRTHTGTSVQRIDLTNGQDAGTANDEKTMAIQVFFYAPKLSQETMVNIHSTFFRDDTLITNYGGGAHMTSFAADGIDLYSSHSSFTTVIDLYVYGLKS